MLVKINFVKYMLNNLLWTNKFSILEILTKQKNHKKITVKIHIIGNKVRNKIKIIKNIYIITGKTWLCENSF